MEQHVKNFAIQALRRASLRWKPRNDARKAAKIEYGKYRCNFCQQIVRAKEINVDHIVPVVDPLTGWTTFDDFIERLFVSVNRLQVLCSICHDRKSAQEGVVRTHFRKKKKNVKSTKKTKSIRQ